MEEEEEEKECIGQLFKVHLCKMNKTSLIPISKIITGLYFVTRKRKHMNLY